MKGRLQLKSQIGMVEHRINAFRCYRSLHV